VRENLETAAIRSVTEVAICEECGYATATDMIYGCRCSVLKDMDLMGDPGDGWTADTLSSRPPKSFGDGLRAQRQARSATAADIKELLREADSDIRNAADLMQDRFGYIDWEALGTTGTRATPDEMKAILLEAGDLVRAAALMEKRFGYADYEALANIHARTPELPPWETPEAYCKAVLKALAADVVAARRRGDERQLRELHHLIDEYTHG